MTFDEMYAGSEIKIGATYRFDYPIEFVTLPEYSAHRGALVVVEKPDETSDVLWDSPNGVEEIVDRMFLVRAVADDWIGHAWESELTAT